MTRNIQIAAKNHGINFHLVESTGVLTCFWYRPLKKTSIGVFGSKNIIFSDNDGKEYNKDVVFCGICNYSFHHGRKDNRFAGHKYTQGSYSYWPPTSKFICDVRLTIKIYNDRKSIWFCYLLCDFGSMHHKYHPFLILDMVSRTSKNLSESDKKLLNSTNNATRCNTAMYWVLMDHSNEYVTKSSAKYIVDNLPNKARAKK